MEKIVEELGDEELHALLAQHTKNLFRALIKKDNDFPIQDLHRELEIIQNEIQLRLKRKKE